MDRRSPGYVGEAAHGGLRARGRIDLVSRLAVLAGAAATILLLAGEPSGDQHGAAVARALRDRLGRPRLLGIGGPLMEREGVELIAGLDDLAIMGFAEVLPRLPFFLRLERLMRTLLQDTRVDLVLPIDYPGFNMRIARRAHRRGVPVLYYIAPQVWAWRAGRAAELAEMTDHIAVILPFEADVLRAAGARATFVGHPLLDRPHDVPSRERFCESWGLDPGRRLLAVLPGSRAQEIRRHLGPFVAAARRIVETHPDVVPVLARAPDLPATPFHDSGLAVVEGTRAVLRHAAAGLVKSGTATLEAALEGLPFVIAYRTSSPTWAVAKRVVRVDHIGLPNLIVGERVVPELLQDEVTPDRIAQALAPLLVKNSPERRRQLDELARVRALLGSPGAAGRVAELAAGLLERRDA